MDSWIIWLIVAAVLGVAELVTLTFAFGLIAVAAVVAAVVGVFHLDLAAQLAAFVVAAGAGLVFVRPIAIRHIKQPPALRTGTAALVGRARPRAVVRPVGAAIAQASSPGPAIGIAAQAGITAFPQVPPGLCGPAAPQDKPYLPSGGREKSPAGPRRPIVINCT